MTMSGTYHLALRDFHAGAGARFGRAGQWSLPHDYGDRAREHTALRSVAVVADTSHHSRFMVTGTDALEVLRAVFAGHLEEMEEGRAVRTVALDAGGEIRDLVLVARTGAIAYMVSGAPERRVETRARLEAAVGDGWDARIDDRTEVTCALVVAGPEAADVAARHLEEALPARLPRMHTVSFQFHGFRGLAVRTTDTGEDGFTFVLAPAVALHVLETLRAAGVPLAGTGTLEVARVEACIPAAGPDLEGLSPSEAELSTLLDVPGGRHERTLVALLWEQGVGALPGAGTALRSHGVAAGELRSCVESPALGTIGLGVVASSSPEPGLTLDADGAIATIVRKPFFRPTRRS